MNADAKRIISRQVATLRERREAKEAEIHNLDCQIENLRDVLGICHGAWCLRVRTC